jgi:hypothetical protein
MCLAVYIAADQPLPEIDWDEHHPAFYIRRIQPSELSVRKHFTKPHIYSAGAHEGCGCGFSYGLLRLNGIEEDPVALAAGQESVRRLSAYLSEATAKLGPVELYACDSESVETPPELRATIRPGELGGESFCFQVNEFFVVQPET